MIRTEPSGVQTLPGPLTVPIRSENPSHALHCPALLKQLFSVKYRRVRGSESLGSAGLAASATPRAGPPASVDLSSAPASHMKSPESGAQFGCPMWTRTRRLRFHATDSSDPLTSLRFGDRSKRRKRQKLLTRTDHFCARSKSPVH